MKKFFLDNFREVQNNQPKINTVLNDLRDQSQNWLLICSVVLKNPDFLYPGRRFHRDASKIGGNQVFI